MTTALEDRPHPVVGALAEVRSLLGAAVEGPVWSLDDGRLAEQVVEAGAVVAQAQALLLRLVGEADAREVLLADGAPSPQAWVRHRLRISPTEASAYVRTGRALRTGLTETAEACGAGRLGLGQAATIARSVEELPVDRQQEAERDLVAHAATFDPVVLGRLGRRMLAAADPQASDERDGDALARAEERAARRLDLSFTPDGEGGSWLRGRLDPEGTAVVRSALDPLSGPRPSAADGPDLRPAGRRRAEALVEVCRRVLAGGTLPESGGDRPQVVVTIPLSVLRDGIGAAPGGAVARGGPEVHGAARAGSVARAGGAACAGGVGGGGCAGAGRGGGVAVLDDGTVISATAARRLACDAVVVPAVLGGRGEVLDVGRARRLFSGPLRRALVLRDRGCAFPGCDRPASWCEAHHIRPWAAGGVTALDNGVLLCGHHHRLVELGDWQIDLAADGVPEFRPPPWIDPDRHPRRNHLHQARAPA